MLVLWYSVKRICCFGLPIFPHAPPLLASLFSKRNLKVNLHPSLFRFTTTNFTCLISTYRCADPPERKNERRRWHYNAKDQLGKKAAAAAPPSPWSRPKGAAQPLSDGRGRGCRSCRAAEIQSARRTPSWLGPSAPQQHVWHDQEFPFWHGGDLALPRAGQGGEGRTGTGLNHRRGEQGGCFARCVGAPCCSSGERECWAGLGCFKKSAMWMEGRSFWEAIALQISDYSSARQPLHSNLPLTVPLSPPLLSMSCCVGSTISKLLLTF